MVELDIQRRHTGAEIINGVPFTIHRVYIVFESGEEKLGYALCRHDGDGIKIVAAYEGSDATPAGGIDGSLVLSYRFIDTELPAGDLEPEQFFHELRLAQEKFHEFLGILQSFLEASSGEGHIKIERIPGGE